MVDPEIPNVIDTNVLISAMLTPASKSAKAVGRALSSDRVIFSKETFAELSEVAARERFNRHLSSEKRPNFMRGSRRQ